jgi:ribosomal protein S18 acetylase RimI-like enzyme
MTDLNFEVTVGRPNPKDYKVLSDGMLLYHAKQGHRRTSEVINIFLKDDNKKVHGGIIVTVLWNGMEINSLWVEESLRNQGWGRKLVAAAEKEGKARDCTIAYTNTFTWQAPGFYEKLGYKPYGKLENFPKGNTLTYFCKNL